jgi:AcrR family transcriptional regulator
MARKTQRDWLETAVNLLAETGFKGLTIDALTQRLDVTKGSFYHHFGSYQGFKTRFLQFYEEEGTLAVIERAEEAATPEAKLRRLFEIVVTFSELSARPEVALRAWALQDDEVRQMQQRVDERRTGYVQALLNQIMENEAQALMAARLLYATLVGAEQMQPSVTGANLQKLFDEILRFYGIV